MPVLHGIQVFFLFQGSTFYAGKGRSRILVSTEGTYRAHGRKHPFAGLFVMHCGDYDDTSPRFSNCTPRLNPAGRLEGYAQALPTDLTAAPVTSSSHHLRAEGIFPTRTNQKLAWYALALMRA